VRVAACLRASNAKPSNTNPLVAPPREALLLVSSSERLAQFRPASPVNGDLSPAICGTGSPDRHFAAMCI
jgi:hypothetical protein